VNRLMKALTDYPNFFTQAMKLCFIVREDIYPDTIELQPLPKKQIYFAMWWIAHAPIEYPQHFKLTKQLKEQANRKARIEYNYIITNFMDYILKSRKDLRELYSTNTKQETDKFLAWYYIYGLKEYKATDLLTENQKKQLAKPSAEVDSKENIFSVTNLMYIVWSQREDLKKITSLNTRDEINWYIKWFYIQGCKELDLFYCLNPEFIKNLNKPVKGFKQNNNNTITYLMYLLWSYDPLINQKYDLNIDEQRSKYASWFKSQGAKEKGLGKLLLTSKQSPMSVSPLFLQYLTKDKPNQNIFGVNLVGYATGDLGIGEDVRMMVKCFEKTGIPFCVINRKPDKNISQSDNSIVHYIEKTPKYAITILCMTGLESIDLWLKKTDLFQNKYIIGYWPWELPNWPKKWFPAYNLVNEIWASTTFTQKAYADSPVPVFHFPMAVSIKQLTKKYTRKYFSLPKKRYLFLFVFDFMSYVARKNPYACIKAFEKAFPLGSEKANLVLKISNIQKENKQWQHLLMKCSEDKRIIIIDETLRREEVLGLFDVCDAYLSLHCSEGFGRTLAEAMLLRKPVIATNFSGNVDFINTKNAYPVKYSLKKIKKGVYPGCKGQMWAHANTSDAALYMQALFKSKNNQESITLKTALSDEYTINNCSIRYKERIESIRHQDLNK